MPPKSAADAVSEALILFQTGCKQLSDVTKLDLSNLGIETIHGDLFSQMPNLQDLNVSQNSLGAFPEDLGLQNLQKLDVSDNHMRSFLSLAQFQKLEHVNIQDNPYTVADRGQLTFLLPNLKSVDGETIPDSHRSYLKKTFGTSLEEKVEDLWENRYMNLFRMSQSAEVQRLLQDQFIQTAKQKIQAGPASMEQLRDWRIETIASKLVAEHLDSDLKEKGSMSSKRSCDESSTNGDASKLVEEDDLDGAKGADTRLSKRLQDKVSANGEGRVTRTRSHDKSSANGDASMSSKRSHDKSSTNGEASMPSKRSHDEATTNGNASGAEVPSKRPRRVTSLDNVVDAGNISRSQRTRNGRITIECLPKDMTLTPMKKTVRKPATKGRTLSKDSTAEYEPTHILQCHSVRNDRNDHKTMVWKCVFEPNPDNTEESTSIVATCGGESVCLLDCRTGKVVQKFSQPKEEFFCIAWMTIPLDGRSEKMTNILAVGGKRGKVYLVHPQQNIWYAEHEAHRRDVCCMVPHQDHSTWMYTGSYDKTIRLWDISPPKLPNYECRIKKLAEWSPPSIPLHILLFPEHDLLLAACRSGCFGFMLNHKQDNWKKTYTIEFTFPKVEKQTEEGLEVDTEFMDCMTLISSEVIASKLVGHGCIYLWNLPETLRQSAKVKGKGPKSLKVKPVAQLEWSSTFIDYIYFKMWPGYDVLVCGDDVGNTWLYDVSKFMSRKWAENTPVPPAQKLWWPDCNWNGTRLTKDSDDNEVPPVILPPSSLSDKTQMVPKAFPRKLPSVNDAAISSSGDYIVGVTDCNLVYVWRKTKAV